jgi:hypothetical protein
MALDDCFRRELAPAVVGIVLDATAVVAKAIASDSTAKLRIPVLIEDILLMECMELGEHVSPSLPCGGEPSSPSP